MIQERVGASSVVNEKLRRTINLERREGSGHHVMGSGGTEESSCPVGRIEA